MPRKDNLTECKGDGKTLVQDLSLYVLGIVDLGKILQRNYLVDNIISSASLRSSIERWKFIFTLKNSHLLDHQ